MSDTEPTTTAARRVALASALGTTVEYYDFTLYATTAALVFDKVFFPTTSSAVGLLASFSTFFVGYLARPLGGLVFGHFGDRLGRKAMLVTTLLIMGIGTMLIGLLPSYATIGVAAPILLVTIRLLQGLGMGGEYGGGVLMALEFAPKRRQGFYTSLVHIGTPAGVLIPVALVTVLTSVLGPERFEAWGWRLPFLLSVVLIGVGLYLRLKISESPEFRDFRARSESHRAPAAYVVRHHLRDVASSIVAKIAESGLFNVYYVVALAYATTQLGMPETQVLVGVLIACAVECVTLPLFGRLSDRIGRRRLYIGGALFQLLLAVPYFLLLDTRNPVLVTLAMVLGLGVGHGAMYGAQAALFANLYPVGVRYTGLSLTQQIGATLGGGLSPLLGSALIAAAGGGWIGVVGYMAGVAILSSLCTVPLRRGEAATPQPAPRAASAR